MLRRAPQVVESSRVRLAAYAAWSDEATSARADATTQPTTRSAATQPAARTGYTAPRLGFRGLSAVAAGLVIGLTPETLGAGREISESVAFSASGTIGRLGLTAPPATVGRAVVGRPGLQEGRAATLGFASSVNNIFQPRANPLSGSGGRCNDLAKAGFFGGSRATCEAHFR
ncbi:MAG: hypothetical protein IID40_04220 [Planctomycetes bacterium]|nr:hypothetical protein [Planctomycetota bacterium]